MAQIDSLMSATTSINGLSPDYEIIFESILVPHILCYAQERSLAMQRGCNEMPESMKDIPTWLQCRFGPLLAKVNQEIVQKGSKHARGVCFDFQKVSCTRGEACRFEHIVDAVATKRVKGVCRDFQKGSCKRGDKCIYSHDSSEGKSD